MAAVAGLRGSGDWGTDERPKNFREFIMWRSPNGSAPMFALMSRVQKESVDDPEFSWWDEPNDLLRLQVNGALGVGDTTVVVDSSDPSATAPGNVWGVAKHLVPGDLLLVEPATDVATFANEYIKVVSIVSDTQFTVERGAAGSTAAAIANDLFLLKVGTQFSEGSAAPASATRNPIKYFNYTQIFKTSYEITRTAGATRARTGDPVANDKRRRSFDHARDIEMALLFGSKSETTGANGKPQRTMDGLRKYIPSATSTMLGASYTLDDFLDAISPAFDFDTPAGDTRIAFVGNSALNFLNKKIAAASGSVAKWDAVRINFNSGAKQFGMNFIEFTVPQGRILLKSHPLMNRHGLYKNSMFMVDFSSIRWRPLRGADTKMMDNIQNKDEDLRRGQWLTEAGLEVRFGGLTNAYIGGFEL